MSSIYRSAHRRPKSKYRRSNQQQSASTPPPAISASISVHMSSPASLPTAFLSRRPSHSMAPPLTILPVPARTGIVVSPGALSHLQTSSTPASDDNRTQQMQQQAIRQGFRLRGPQQARTVSSQILPPLSNLPPSRTSALVPPHPMIRSWSQLQHSDMGIDLDVSMGLTDSDADAEGVTDEEVIVPLAHAFSSLPAPMFLRHARTSRRTSARVRRTQV